MGWFTGSVGKGYAKAIKANPDLVKDFDFGKEVMKPKAAAPGEQIVDGATHESIAAFKRSRETRRDAPEARPGLMVRLCRRLFGKGSSSKGEASAR